MPPKTSPSESLRAEFLAITSGNDVMIIEALPSLAEALRISPDDVVMYVIAWKLGAKVPLQISIAEWIDGLSAMRIDSVKKLQQALPNLRSEIATSAQQFKSFYNFAFEWVRESPGAKYLPNEGAADMWELLFSNRNFPLLPSWLEFIRSAYKKPVSRDLWRQLLDFSLQLGSVTALASYDPNSAWPTAMDDFVEWMKARAI